MTLATRPRMQTSVAGGVAGDVAGGSPDTANKIFNHGGSAGSLFHGTVFPDGWLRRRCRLVLQEQGRQGIAERLLTFRCAAPE